MLLHGFLSRLCVTYLTRRPGNLNQLYYHLQGLSCDVSNYWSAWYTYYDSNRYACAKTQLNFLGNVNRNPQIGPASSLVQARGQNTESSIPGFPNASKCVPDLHQNATTCTVKCKMIAFETLMHNVWLNFRIHSLLYLFDRRNVHNQCVILKLHSPCMLW